MRQITILILFSTALLFTLPAAAKNYFTVTPDQPTESQISENKSNGIEGLHDHVLKAAINAYEWAVTNHRVKNPSMLTIVDFELPSYQKRLWVIDLNNKHVIMHMHVAQGIKSGKVYATQFSNTPGSLESSLGVFTTTQHDYHGSYGESLRLIGLQPGINDNAFKRGIILHSEWDVTPDFIRTMKYAGRTSGCFAVNPDHINRLIQLTQNGSVLFAYASPEAKDPVVNHPLSSFGQSLFEKIKKVNNNPFVKFFEKL